MHVLLLLFLSFCVTLIFKPHLRICFVLKELCILCTSSTHSWWYYGTCTGCDKTV